MQDTNGILYGTSIRGTEMPAMPAAAPVARSSACLLVFSPFLRLCLEQLSIF